MQALIAGHFAPSCELPVSRRREGVVHVRIKMCEKCTPTAGTGTDVGTTS